MQKRKDTILIIEDNPINLTLLFNYLEKEGYHVLVSTDGSTALELIQNISPDLILLDIMMPGLNGFEVCHHLKHDEATKEIPIIFLTALDTVEHELQGLELGAVDYVVKPINVKTISARIKTHLTIQRLQRKLEQRNAELDAFAHTVAHELKNPLSVIVAYGNYMRNLYNDISPQELLDVSTSIERSGQKAINIVEELLVLAGVRKAEVTLAPINMGDLVEQSLARLSWMQKEYQAKIEQPDSWPRVLGYAPWIEAVWMNYLSNALKYGGEPPRLQLGATPQQEGMVRFWVQDNGPGLSAAEQSKLFVEFSRLNKELIAGHGLGLSIVQRIIDSLDGTVGVESTVGVGSLFYFTLPLVED